MQKNVFFLEDDSNIQDLVKFTLEMNGITCHCFSTIKDFKDALIADLPDIALLDIMLEDGNGLDVLDWVKTNYSNIYCIMLSALGTEIDKVKGLNGGADDYITKPFGVLEFTAKINAVFRRMDKQETTITRDNVRLNADTMQVFVDDNEIALSSKEFKLLSYAMKNSNKVLSRDELLTNVWGYSGETRTLDNYIAHLRKLGFSGFETVFGVGYKYKTKDHQ